MALVEIACPGCATPHRFDGALAFREECERCAADLHVCITCRFHDRYVENECREHSAEYVADKRKRNLCEYYKPKAPGVAELDETAVAKARLAALFGGAEPVPPQPSIDDARARLEALFKKK